MNLLTSHLLYGVFLVVFTGTLALAENRLGHLLAIEQLTKDDQDRIQTLWSQHLSEEKGLPMYSALHSKLKEGYPCMVGLKSNEVPTSVHALRPGDVKVVAAMGDSLTAGSGIDADNILEVLIQYRGLSWSGRGQTDFNDQITLPNILKKHSADLYGYATDIGGEDSSGSVFNVAVIGSRSSNLVAQTKELVKRMKADKNVDFANDWKIVTILSGNNDLCDYCHDTDNLNSKMFRENVIAALDILHAELPRTLVNLVEPLNVEIVRDLNKGLLCALLHIYECDCAAFPEDETAYQTLIQEGNLMKVAVEEIALSGRYDTKDDFTVVFQPFFNKTFLPRKSDGKADYSYFAPDCFHFSRKGQAAAASGLWNNMIEPVSEKSTSWSADDELNCPSEDQPYFFTNKNSSPKQRDATRALFAQQKEEKQKEEEASKVTSSRHALIILAVFGVVAFVAVAAIVVRKTSSRRNGYHRV